MSFVPSERVIVIVSPSSLQVQCNIIANSIRSKGRIIYWIIGDDVSRNISVFRIWSCRSRITVRSIYLMSNRITSCQSNNRGISRNNIYRTGNRRSNVPTRIRHIICNSVGPWSTRVHRIIRRHTTTRIIIIHTGRSCVM